MAVIMEWRLLQAHEIQVRAGQKTKKGDKIALLLYKDARADMNRLDEQFGEYGWQREHKDVHGVTYCGVSLWSTEHNCWVTKWDAGEKSNTAPEKGEASDSFKRACVNWGIGRELYTAPRIYVPIETDLFGLSVSEITYDENRRIKTLTIVDSKGGVIYSNSRSAARKPAASVIVPKQQENEAAEEYTAILADLDAAQSLDQLKATMTQDRTKRSPYIEALKRIARNKAVTNGWMAA